VGRRGPRPAPTAIKLAKGERRPSRVNYDEPEVPEVDDLKPPPGLAGVALAEWRRLGPQLRDVGVLRTTDLGALEDYCRRLGDLRSYETRAKRAGVNAISMGYAGMVTKLQAQVNALRREFGLTPASRSSVRIPPGLTIPKDQKTARYLHAIAGGKR